MDYFTCQSGSMTCIQERFKCDCSNDCQDGSDETESYAGCTALQVATCQADSSSKYSKFFTVHQYSDITLPNSISIYWCILRIWMLSLCGWISIFQKNKQKMQQCMFTPPKQLIPPLLFPGVRFNCPTINFVFRTGFMRLISVQCLHSFCDPSP